MKLLDLSGMFQSQRGSTMESPMYWSDASNNRVCYIRHVRYCSSRTEDEILRVLDIGWPETLHIQVALSQLRVKSSFDLAYKTVKFIPRAKHVKT